MVSSSALLSSDSSLSFSSSSSSSSIAVSSSSSPPLTPSPTPTPTSLSTTRSPVWQQAAHAAQPGTTANLIPTAERADKMAPRGTQRGSGRTANAQRREADLSALLSAPQKDELVLLAASITNAMQDQISQVFDKPLQPLASYGPSSMLANPLPGKTPPGKRPAPLLKADSPAAGQAPNQTSGSADQDGEQTELKREALAAFQKWQASVTKRFAEITVAAEPPPQSPAKPTNSTRFSARGAGRGLGGGRGKTADARSATGSAAAQPAAAPSPGVSSGPLMQLVPEKRQLLLHAVMLLLLSLETYPAYSRVFIARLAAHFRAPPRFVAEEEARLAWSLSHAASSVCTEDGIPKKSDDGKRDRRGRSATAAALAAPSALAPALSSARIGSIVSTGAGSGSGSIGIGPAAAATVLGPMGTLSDGGIAACVFFGLCGSRGSPAKTLDAFTKDVQDVGLIPMHGAQKLEVREGKTLAPEDRRLRLSIGISGWLMHEDDAVAPWSILGDRSEAYALRWELETLLKVGSSLDTVVGSMAWKNAKKESTNQEVLSNPKAFEWPNSLLKISKLVDNPWSMGMVRADKVGIALADAIINKVQGERSVSLLGYSLGARAIYTCLMSLSERRVFGLVENVVLMGTPAPSSRCVWTALRSAVAGRVINVFSENDFLLGFLHRTGCVQFGVAGLQRIQGVYGIENVDASKPITNHLRYAGLVPRILKDIGWEDINMNEMRKVEDALKAAETKPGVGHKDRTERERADTTAPQQQQQQQQKQQQKPSRGGRKKAGRRKLESQFQALSISH